MRRYLWAFMAILCYSLCINATARAALKYEYEVDDYGVIITSFYFDDAMDVAEFPKNIDGLPVTRIGKYAYDTYAEAYCVSRLILPDTLCELEEGALFRMSSYVEEIVIPLSLNAIGDFTFSGTKTRLTLSDKHKYFSKIEEFLIENKTQKAIYCDYVAENRKRIVIPEGIIILGTDLFNEWWELETVVLPQSLIEIGDFAFSGCISLTQVVFSDNIKRINYGAFRECYELSELYLPQGLLYIGVESFAGCSSLRTLVCPQELKVIDTGAFMQLGLSPDPGLRELVLNDGLLYIGADAFYGNQLESIEFADSIQYVGENAFAKNLKPIIIELNLD